MMYVLYMYIPVIFMHIYLYTKTIFVWIYYPFIMHWY